MALDLDDEYKFSVRHVPLPAVLVRLELSDGRKTAMLCYPHADLDERLDRYTANWNSLFTDKPIKVVSKEILE